MSGDCYNILGQRVLVRCTSPEFAGQVQHLMRSFPVCPETASVPDFTLSLVMAPPSRDPAIRRFHFVYRDGYQVGRTTRPWEAFRFLECQLDFSLAANVTHPLLLHAGAVARNGAGVLLPGPSGSGKSSLSLALAQQGYHYLSDEVGVVDQATGWLHPFPKAVSIKDRSIFNGLARYQDLWLGPEADEGQGVWYLHPEDLPGGRVGVPSPIGYIVFPKYHAKYQPRLRPLSPGEALKELLHNSINLSRSGNEGFRLLTAMAQGARCFALESNDLATSVALIDRLSETGA